MKFENGDECGEIYEVTDEAMEWLRKIDALYPQIVVYDDEYNWHTEDKDGKITGRGIHVPKGERNNWWHEAWKEKFKCQRENIPS